MHDLGGVGTSHLGANPLSFNKRWKQAATIFLTLTWTFGRLGLTACKVTVVAEFLLNEGLPLNIDPILIIVIFINLTIFFIIDLALLLIEILLTHHLTSYLVEVPIFKCSLLHF